MQEITPLRSYRCTYAPISSFGTPHACESGALPYVQLKAANAEDALHKAHHVTGCPVVDAERQSEEVAA